MEISSIFLQISGLILISLAFFYLAKHWSNVSHQLIFFNSRQTPLLFQNPFPHLSLLQFEQTFDLNSLINNTTQTQTQTQPLSDPTLPSIPSTSHPKPLPPSLQERYGIVDENGKMPNDFEVGDFDPGVVDNWVDDPFSSCEMDEYKEGSYRRGRGCEAVGCRFQLLKS
ncbi:unnamed protein product [Camellia sinensis]